MIHDWCENHVHFSHKNKEMVEIIKNSDQTKLFSIFFPIKPQCFSSRILAGMELWGSKWDTEFEIVDSSENFIVLRFVCISEPPIKFYEKMSEIGFQIDALFHEPNNRIIGYYNNSNGCNNLEYPRSPEDYEKLSKEFDYAFGIYTSWINSGIETYAEKL